MLLKRTCHTISPFFTRWQDSMYESAYHRDPDEVLPYLQAYADHSAHADETEPRLSDIQCKEQIHEKADREKGCYYID